jgi:hypothetical protein
MRSPDIDGVKMNRSKRMMAIALGLGLAAGCAHQVTPEEARAKTEQAMASGRDKFYEELAQKNVTWYVLGGQTSTGYNRQTGLPEQMIPSGGGETQNAGYVKSHNDAILNYISTNGPIPGSFGAYESSLFDQAGYFKSHSDEQPLQLKDGNPITSPDGQYTLSIGRPGGATATQLMVEGPDGRHQVALPAGASEPSAEVLFGPAGSDLAFTRWPGAGGELVYAALNFRNGKYLVVQRGGK